MICDRCGEETIITTMSWFNEDIICDSCDDTERAHPLFETARRIETEHTMQGDYRFPGIGLPADLEGRKI